MNTKKRKDKKPVIYKLGLGLLLLAIVCWVIAATSTIIPVSLGIKASIITGSLIVGEIFFWIGAVFVGKEVVTKYRSYLNPKNWFKKERGQDNE